MKVTSTVLLPDRDDSRQRTEPALLVDGVHKHYGDVHAVDGVSLAVAPGEFFGVIGPNGAGKTTLIEMMEGLRKADAGTVSVLGIPSWPRHVALLPRIGVQTQKSAFFARLTAREHLTTVAGLYRTDAAAADRALALVGLTAQGGTRVEKLSGGQRQRLAIASALVHEPEVIFLDEPTASLDPQARRALWDVLRGLKGAGRTIVYTTHHLDEAEALCDRVAIMLHGVVVALDSPHNLVSASTTATRLLVPADRITAEQARNIDGVDSVSVEGGSVVLSTRSAGRVLAAVSDVAGLDGVQTRTATLEDVYLELTGTEHQS
jgi:ABC-2 type transport system ATP-binding protein